MSFDVIITAFRMNARESASQVLERVFGFEPQQARHLVRQFPATVISGTTCAHAEAAAEQLRAAGAKVEVVDREVVDRTKPRAKTEPLAFEVSQPGADAARTRQERALAPTESFGSDSLVTGDVPRKMFSTVAMQNIEADLRRFEVTDFGPPPAPAPVHNNWADSLPPTPTLTAKSETNLPHQPNLSGTKQELPDVEELFAPPPPKGNSQGVVAMGSRPSSEFDDLFSPPGADDYFKPTAKVSPSSSGSAPKQGTLPRPIAPRRNGLGSEAATGAPRVATQGTRNERLAKATAGVAALAVMVLIGVATIKSCDSQTLNKPGAAKDGRK